MDLCDSWGHAMLRRQIGFVFLVILAGGAVHPAFAQDWFKTGTGLGVERARVAAPEFAARTSPAQPLQKVFHEVLWNDLD
jgi:hypothetical protein